MFIQRSWFRHRSSRPIAQRPTLDCAVLESRTLFSATPLNPSLVLDPAADLDGEPLLDESNIWDELTTAATAVDSEPDSPQLELLFVDAEVNDWQQLTDDFLNASPLDRELQVFRLDGSRDGIQQISDVLNDLTDVGAIHLVSHGADGQLRLGNQWLNHGNLVDYADDLAIWNEALSDDADVLLYGCDVAASEVGREFVSTLGILSGCDVAASNNTTGHEAVGGDWLLEFSTGRIDVGLPLTPSVTDGWQHSLALQTVRDEFTTASFSNNDGTTTWDGNWIEADLIGGGATGGNIQITGQELQVEANNTGDYVYREVDLSAAATASLTFDVDNQLGAGGVVFVQASSNGGGSWSNLWTYNNGNTGVGSEVIDLAAYRGPDTQIRIIVNSQSGGTSVQLDNVEVVFDVNQPTVAQNDTYVIDEDSSLDTSTTWWDANWSHRRTLSFDNLAQTEDLNDFPVLVALDSTRIDYGLTQNNGNDLRFVDGDGTLLEHEIERWDELGTSFVWVRVPQINGSSETDFIWMYYGNGSATNVEDSAAVWSSNYRSVYHLEGNPGGGGTVVDAAGNFDGTNGGSADVSGRIGNAQRFDGANDFINMGEDEPFLNSAGQVTISAWVNADGTVGSQSVLGVSIDNGGTPTDSSRATLNVSGNNVRLSGIADDTASFTEYFTTSNPLTVGQWHHITGVIDYGSATFEIYVDGVLQTTSTATGIRLNATQTSGGNSTRAVIGANESFGSNYYDGAIDEARLSSAARSADWIAAQYASMNDALITYGYEQTVAGVLGNDIDPDGDVLTAVQVGADPANAQSFTFNPDGSFTYTPVANFFGVDTFSYQVNDGTANSNIVTVSIVVNPVNDSPSLATTGTNPNFVEDGGPVSLFSGSIVDLVEMGDQVRTIEMTVAGLQNGVDEQLAVDGQLISLFDGNSVTTAANGFDVSVSVTGATATVTITAASDYSAAQAQSLIDGLQYENSSDVPQGASRTVTIARIEDSGGTLNGGDDDETPNITSVVAITPSNDPPTLVATGSNPTFVEGGPAVGLFSGTAIDTIETGDSVRTIRLTVNGLQNGISENLVIDGTNVAMSDGNIVTTAGSGFRVNVSIAGGTATVTITRVGDFAAADAELLIDSLQYENLSLTPLGANRTVTISLIEDSGGTLNGGDDDTILSVSSIVTLVAVNDAPSLNATAQDPSFMAGGVPLFSATTVDLMNPTDLVGLIELTVTGLQDIGEALVVDGTSVLLIDGNSVTTAANGYDVNVTVVGGTATVTITRVGDYATAAAETLVNGLQYDNPSGAPSGPGRTVTLTLIRDTGGTANGGDDDTVLAIASSVTFGTPGTNNRPEGMSDSYAVVGDSTLNVGFGGVLANDTDLDANLLSALLTSGPTNGTLALNPDGSFSYAPALGFVGTDTFVYVAHDGLDSSDPITVSITVEAPYIPPSIDPTTNDSPSQSDGEDDSDSSEATPEVIDVMPAREDARLPIARRPLPQRQNDSGVSVIDVLESVESDNENAEQVIAQLQVVSLPQLNVSRRAIPAALTPRRAGVNYAMQGGMMWDDLDQMSEQMEADAERLDITIGSTATLTATVSVGYVVWLIRGGHIMAGVLAQLPAWHMVDPLPILTHLRNDEEDELDDSLASLVGPEKEAVSNSPDVVDNDLRPQDKWNFFQ